MAEMPEIVEWCDVAYGNGKFVAISKNNDVTAISPDGITWTIDSMPSVSTWTTISYVNNLFVVFGMLRSISKTVSEL